MDKSDHLSLSVVANDIFSVDESGKSIENLKGKSGKTISIGCLFPPKFANSGSLSSHCFKNKLFYCRKVGFKSIHDA